MDLDAKIEFTLCGGIWIDNEIAVLQFSKNDLRKLYHRMIASKNACHYNGMML